MILGIDATNIRAGGGLTHLKEILGNVNPTDLGFEKVIVWSNDKTLNALPDLPWLLKITHKLLNKSAVWSFYYQWRHLSKDASSRKCDLIFVPGGTFFGNFKPIVSMSQNMLPFSKDEYNRFESKSTKARFKFLNWSQSKTFKKSKGIIFLTRFAKNEISKQLHLEEDKCTIIPHGTQLSFVQEPKIQKSIEHYNQKQPFTFLYVSTVTAYKHQANVAKAILRLYDEGFPVKVDFIGGLADDPENRFQDILKSQSDKQVLNYKGLVPHDSLAGEYFKADAFIFASTCENMPIILIEAMSAGLPIACSNYGPMPEVLGEGGVYIDPLNVDSVYSGLKTLLESSKLRTQIASIAFNNLNEYTWQECAKDTFTYLAINAK